MSTVIDVRKEEEFCNKIVFSEFQNINSDGSDFINIEDTHYNVELSIDKLEIDYLIKALQMAKEMWFVNV